MQSNIATILMDRRISVWKTRQRRSYLNFKLKTVNFVAANKLVLLICVCWTGYVLADHWIHGKLEEPMSSTATAENPPETSAHTASVDLASPSKEIVQIEGNTDLDDQKNKVTLRLSYEMTLPATQTVSEVK